MKREREEKMKTDKLASHHHSTLKLILHTYDMFVFGLNEGFFFWNEEQENKKKKNKMKYHFIS